MPKYEHQNNAHQIKRQKRRARLYIGAVLVVVLIVGVFLAIDLLKAPKTILESPGLVLADEDRNDTLLWQTPYYRFETPLGWRQGVSDDDERYEVYRYDHRGSGNRGRYIEIYVNDFPGGESFNRIQLVKQQGKKLELEDMSRQCYIYGNETGLPSDYIHEIVSVKYKKVEFRCQPSSILNKVGLFTKKTGNDLQYFGRNGQTSLYIVYVDDNIQQKDSYLEDIIESFRFK